MGVLKNLKRNPIFVASCTVFLILAMMVAMLPTPVAAGETPTGTPIVYTDKADYLPEETVVITGTGLAAGALYDVPVIRPDGTIVYGDGSFLPGWDTVQADASGSFTYNYQLDGIPGLYEVRVYDSPWSGNPDEQSLSKNFFLDNGGAYTIKWYGADPAVNRAPYLPTYPKLLPSQVTWPLSGRQSDPLKDAVCYADPPVPSNLDAVTSLVPKNMMLGQVVPFEVEILVSGSTTPENGVISFVGGWFTHTTSGDDFGYDPNYKVIAAFVDTADPGTIDPGKNASAQLLSSKVVGSGGTEEIQGTIQVSGLDDGDKVIVEIWVVLKNSIPAKASGNVQTELISGTTATGDKINTGTQRVNLMQVGDFYAAKADVSIAKTDSPDPVTAGQDVTYTITATNNSSDTVANGVVITDTLDPNVTWKSGGTYSAGPPATVTWNVGGLSPGASVTETLVVTVNASAPTENFAGSTPDNRGGATSPSAGTFDINNKVVVSAITDDGNTANNTYYQPTNVLAAMPAVAIDKTADTDPTLPGNQYTLDEPGGDVVFTFVITNTGPNTITLSKLVDTELGDITNLVSPTLPGTVLSPGASATFTYTHLVTGEGGDTWQNTVTVTAYDAYGQKAEASDSLNIAITVKDVPPTITLTKTASPASLAEPGGTFTFTYTIHNGSVEAVKLTRVTDDVLGTLYEWKAGDPEVWIAAGGDYLLPGTFTKSYSEAGKYTNIAWAYAVDNEGNEAKDDDTKTVEVTDVLPTVTLDKSVDPASLPEPGGVFHFTLVVKNTSVESVTITGFSDSNGVDLSSYIGTVLAPGETLTIKYDITHTEAGTYPNTASVTVKDNEGNTATATDSEKVIVTDVLPTITLTKTASPASLAEPGGTFTFTYTIHNGSVEAVKLTKVTDDVLGTLYEWKAGDPEVWIAAGGDYLLPGTFTKSYTEAGKYTNIAWAYAVDNEGNEAKDDDTKTVEVTDVLPTITVDKSADKDYVVFSGQVTFTVVITNKSVEPVSLTSVMDDVYGDVADPANPKIISTTASLPHTIPVGGSYSFQFVAVVTGDLGLHTDTVTGTAYDNEGNPAKASDYASVMVYAQVKVTKTVNGKPFSGPDLTFQIRTGAFPVNGETGTILETQIASVSNSGQVTFNTLLLPGLYELCEIVPEGYVPTYTFGIYGVDWFKPGYAPGQGGLDPNILVAVFFRVNPDGTIDYMVNYPGDAQRTNPSAYTSDGQTQHILAGGSIAINNQVGQMPRTIGYWKNHASSKESNGGQAPILDQMLYKATNNVPSATIQIGTLLLPGGSTPDNARTSAVYAVRLLNKSTIDKNKKMASDPCFNLAAQLLGYRLNYWFGGWPNTVAAAAADYAQAMLLAEHFNGITHDKLSSKAIANLNYLAGVLDSYNNDTLVLGTLVLPYPGVYT